MPAIDKQIETKEKIHKRESFKNTISLNSKSQHLLNTIFQALN